MRLFPAFIATALLAAACATGKISEFDIHLRPHADHIGRCYILLLREDPAAKGEIELEVTVGGDGKVVATALTKNTFPDDRVGACVAEVIRGISFPANNQNKTVSFSYPVMFTSEELVRQ